MQLIRIVIAIVLIICLYISIAHGAEVLDMEIAPISAVESAGAAPAMKSEVLDALIQGEERLHSGELESAASAFATALALAPQNTFAANQLALTQVKQGRLEDAYEIFENVLRSAPDNTFARVWKGVLLLTFERETDARKEFHAVLDIDPHNANAYYFLGAMEAADHNRPAAIRYLLKAQSVNSSDQDTHYRLARAFTGLDMPANALLEYERALALAPAHVGALNGLGWLLFNQGEREAAFARWIAAMDAAPQSREAPRNLATAFNTLAMESYELGEVNKARGYWERALKYAPGHKAAKHYLHKTRDLVAELD